MREVHGWSFEDIAAEVVNLDGQRPVWGTVRNIVNSFSEKKGCRPYHYKKSGRKPWKLTPDVQKFVLKKLLGNRSTQVVTSTSLAEDVAKSYGIVVEASCLRKLLKKKGYKWLPRSQKRKYNREEREARLRFAKAAVRLSKKALREKLSSPCLWMELCCPCHLPKRQSVSIIAGADSLTCGGNLAKPIHQY